MSCLCRLPQINVYTYYKIKPYKLLNKLNLWRNHKDQKLRGDGEL